MKNAFHGLFYMQYVFPPFFFPLSNYCSDLVLHNCDSICNLLIGVHA